MDKLDVDESPSLSLWTLCIAGCFVWPGLFVIFWSILAKRYPPYLACGTAMRLVSGVQAVIQVWCGAVIVSRTYTDVFFKDCKLLDQSTAFATMYWLLRLCCYVHGILQGKLLMKSTVLTSLRSFLKDNPLVCFHHFVVLVGGNSLILHYRFGKAAFMIACVQLTELSTPFLNVRKILIRHNYLTHSILFRVNTAVAVAAFFLTRLVLFPSTYLIYAYSYDQTLWEVVTSMYFGCHFVMIGVMSLQVTWFMLFIKAISQQRKPKATQKEHQNGHKVQNGHLNGRDISCGNKSE